MTQTEANASPKDAALKLALEALEDSEDQLAKPYSTDVRRAITAIKEALREHAMYEVQRLGQEIQPEQEPVAFYVYKPTLPRGHLGNVSDGDLPWVYDQDPSSGYSARMLVYTTPQQRTWVGLTDEDKQIAFDDTQEGGGFWEFADAIEAKLKEKNTWQDGDCKHCVNGCPACDARRQPNVLP